VQAQADAAEARTGEVVARLRDAERVGKEGERAAVEAAEAVAVAHRRALQDQEKVSVCATSASGLKLLVYGGLNY
jgi:hypothetical protein